MLRMRSLRAAGRLGLTQLGPRPLAIEQPFSSYSR